MYNMIELGKYQMLRVDKKSKFGFYLVEPEDNPKQAILLPAKEAPENLTVGDLIKVFIYKDTEDRIIATTKQVPLTIGGLAVLKVKEVSDIGAFLDWGLVKDLFLPFKEQSSKVKVGDNVLVSLYVDKSRRLCATMKVYDLLSTDSGYKKGDIVSGFVYDQIDSFGVFVAVDNIYSAMIPNNELFSPVKIGETIQARVTSVREDGKLNLSLRDKAYVQIGTDSENILDRLKAAGGYLSFNDSSDPEDIKREFKISKNAFKRAIGKLYKDGIIEINDDGIRLVKK
ncbi:MAG: S1 RNA-binding domain-containing protein [Clostridiales bacterium]|nr:S1 RNA-binding domain-containing protein [Clostridiales bacterium]